MVLLLCALIAGSVSLWAAEASFAPSNFSDQGTSGTGSSISATVDGVTFSCDKGYGTTQIRCYSGGKITISSSNTITAISFTFSGSYTGGLETSYKNLSTTSWEKTLSSQARITAATVTYTVQSSSWSVTYDANGATSGTVPTDATEYSANNNTVIVLSNTGSLAKTGYTFSGWNTKADGTGTNYSAGNTFNISANTTLYAKWTANTHNVTLPETDKYGSYTMDATNPVAYGTEVTLTYTSATGYEDYIATWSVNGTIIEGNTFTMPDENITVTVSTSKTMTVDFEKNLNNYADWEFSHIGTQGTTITAHGGSYYGPTTNSSSSGTAYMQTTNKVNPKSITCFVSKSTTNTTDSNWYIQVSSDGSDWQDVGSRSASDMSKGVWKEFSANLSNYSDVYVRIYYTGSTAARCIDDVTLTIRDSGETSINSDAVINLTAEETSGEIAYSISNPIEGNNLTASSTADWISSILVSSEKVTFTTTTNSGDSRSAIITLTYGTLTKEITVNQAKHVVTNTYALTTAVVPGRHYIITNGSSAALGPDRGNNRLAIGIPVSDDQTTFGSDAGITEFLVGIDESTGFFTLFDTDNKKYLSSASSSSNYMKLVESISDDNAKWIITFDESGEAFIQAQGDYTRNIIRYNSSNNPALFSCYASGQNDVYLFEKVGDNGVQSFTVNIAEACTDGKKYYGTFSAPFAFTVPSDVTVSEIGVIDNVLLVEDYTENAVIPANTGVMISSTTPGAKTFTSAKGGNRKLGNDNNLRPTLWGITNTKMSEADAGCMFYRLTMHNANVEGKTSEIGFWWGADSGASFNYQTANRAYLAVHTTNAARQNFWFGSESTGISDSKMAKTTKGSLYYDLQGRQVAQPTKGLYIVNGKIFINK